MSLLNAKSEMSAKGANSLHSIHLFAPSIHCAYYRCFQKMLHIAYNILGISEENLRDEMKVHFKNKNKTGGRHEFLIGYFSKVLKTKNLKESVLFNNSMQQLKTKRHAADYKNIEITESDSSNAIALSTIITEILNKNF